MNYHLIPDWSDPVVETYTFLTSVFTSHSGKEQRMSERLLPRRAVKFSTLLWDEGLTNFHAMLHGRGADTISIPDPARFAAVLDVDAPAGSTILITSSAPAWLKPGMALVLSDIDQSEFRGGSTVTIIGEFSIDYSEDEFNVFGRASIVLTSPLLRDWPAGTVVRPAIEGRLTNEVSIEYRTDMVGESSISLDVLPPSQVPDLTDATFQVFNSRPALLVAPNWSQPPSVSITTPVSQVDYERGVTRAYLPIEFYTRIMQFNYLGRSRESIGQLLQLFVDMRGRQGEFYCPSWVSDMQPVSGVEGGGNLITMAGAGLAETFGSSTVNKAVAIYLNDGRWILRRVLGITVTGFEGDFDPAGEDGLFSAVTLSSAIADDVYRHQISMVCWLNVCRFATDTLTIRWSTDDIGSVVAQIMTLEALTPEA